ncbi:uncharacterized protein PHACADRAFT_250739 [Phanerochaete carnosa HHB-10118-sp]|uniref:Uncharacterized protein n=1 Tax=Phanerochaete carnosa (strain HHB-10118-sp) TaxID=650164 RepID=K5VAP5_PHACS|nr:uncharacterized protein PHACADRAFT_250739 [Phanerochaete carnosa HHB-10118-sp]EKM59931.1 hypothetical protein PHACADRAFT_250739 [Phanerochaete carnosa HHB-10118-sp]
MELALNEAVAALHGSVAPQQPQQPSSPIPDAPPLGPVSTRSSPRLESAVSGPPTSSSSSPTADKASNGDIDMVGAEPLPPSSSTLPNGPSSESLILPIASFSSSTPVTPIAGPSKQPLFFVSPDSPPNDFGAGHSLAGGLSDFVPSGLLGDLPPTSPDKGKQRRYGVDSDIEVLDRPPTPPSSEKEKRVQGGSDVELVQSSDMGELAKAGAGRRWKAEVYILVPSPSVELQSLWGRIKKGPRVVGRRVLSSPESSNEDVDEIAEDFRGQFFLARVSSGADRRVADNETQRKEGM